MARACPKHGLVAGEAKFCPVCGEHVVERTVRTTKSRAPWLITIGALIAVGYFVIRSRKTNTNGRSAPIPAVANQPARTLATPEENRRDAIAKLPKDTEYHIVSGEAMNQLVSQLSGELIRIDAVLMSANYGDHLQFESRDRDFAFEAYASGLQDRLGKLGGLRKLGKVRLWGRWHYHAGSFFSQESRYIDVDRFELVEW